VQAGDVEEVARKAIKDIGYEQDGFHWRNANVEVLLHAQSAHIAKAWTRPATRTKARATRASCSAMPAARPRR
jgi:S-adenosylmethionine synthetase